MPDIVLLLLFPPIVLYLGSKDPARGLCASIAMLVFLPSFIRLSLGGGLPELTVHRIILAICFVQLLPVLKRTPKPIPFFRLLMAIAFLRLLSALLSMTPLASIKDLLGFLIEIMLFYRIALAASTLLPGCSLKMLNAAVIALSVLAGCVFIERYLGFSPLAIIFTSITTQESGIVEYGAQATYPHRILFGYAMAMGVPLSLALMSKAESPKSRSLLWVATALMAGACYFSTSRGAWLGLALALGLTVALGDANQRRRCKWLAAFIVLVLIVRPGVWETIGNKYKETFDANSYKGQSYTYRYRLWEVAFAEVSKSPERFLLGYGGLSTEEMDLGHYFEAQAGGTSAKLGYTSWDNRYACDLIEFGFAGFILLGILFTSVAYRLYVNVLKATESNRSLQAGLFAAASVFIFAQSNVDIFSIQLKFLFWTVVAVGIQGCAVTLDAKNPMGQTISSPPSVPPVRRLAQLLC